MQEHSYGSKDALTTSDLPRSPSPAQVPEGHSPASAPLSARPVYKYTPILKSSPSRRRRSILVDFGTPGSVRKNWEVRHPSPLKVRVLSCTTTDPRRSHLSVNVQQVTFAPSPSSSVDSDDDRGVMAFSKGSPSMSARRGNPCIGPSNLAPYESRRPRSSPRRAKSGHSAPTPSLWDSAFALFVHCLKTLLTMPICSIV
jgi:hypothetical protein